MQTQYHSHTPIRPRTEEPPWYRTYYLAVLEGDRHRAVAKIDRAQRAIRERFDQLRSVPPDNPREPQDLENAMTYLSILLQHMGTESGSVLWD